MLRSQVREEIFKILFRIPFVLEEEMDEQIAYSIEELGNKSEKNLNYIQDKAKAILAKLEEIDHCIEEACEGWNLKRIGKAEITIMRIAVYEMKYEETIPKNVAINEAIELTKLYCDEEAKGFVNAVLGKVLTNIK